MKWPSKISIASFFGINSITIKLLIKNILEKKLRSFLVIFSATAACALIFAAISSSGTIKNIYEQQMRKYSGTADIMIYADKQSPSSFVRDYDMMKFKDRLEYYIGCITSEAVFRPVSNEEVRLTVLGCEYEDLQKFNPVVLVDQEDLNEFSGRSVIIGKAFAEKFQIEKGERISLWINNSEYSYKVVGIGEQHGFFVDDSAATYIIVPETTLATIYNQKGKHSVIYAKVNIGEDISAVKDEISDIYKKYEVKEIVTKKELQEAVAPMASILMVLAVLVSLMSFFIIYTSFKVIIIERFQVVGTLRSIGATIKTARFFLLGESLLYALFGTVTGCLLGCGIAYAIAQLSRSPWMSSESVKLDISISTFVLAFSFTAIICIISSLAPIFKITKIPIKEVILNEAKWGGSKKKASKIVFGTIFVVAAIIIPPICPREYLMPVAGILMVLSLVGVIMLIPFFTNTFLKFFQYIYIKLFGNIGFLATKNIIGNKAEINSISLLAVGMSVMLMVNILSGNITKKMVDFYSEGKFNVAVLNGDNMDRLFKMKLMGSEGVSDACAVYNKKSIEVTNRDGKIALLSGIDTNEYLKFWELTIEDYYDGILKKLETERYILLSTVQKEKFDIEKGEQLILKMGNREQSYTVLSFFNSMRYMGDYALISDRFFKLDIGEKFYSELYVKTDAKSNAEEVAENISQSFSKKGLRVMTLEQLKKLDESQLSKIFMILKIFSTFAMLIAIIGIVNNRVIAFINRRRYLAVQKSVGMSKKQVVGMVFIEALSSGVIGGLAGIISTVLMIFAMQYLLTAINIFIGVPFQIDALLIALGMAVVLMLFVSVSPALKSSKLNIIESIKYE